MKTEAISILPGLLTDANDARASMPASLSPVAVRSKSESLAPILAANRHVLDGSDESLLVQVGKGDKEALSILFQRHARAVHSVARRILKDDFEAEDLLQELFLFIFQKATSFDATKGSGTFGRGERKGEAVPRHAKNFLRGRIRPISGKLGIPNRLVTFQVMRRSLGTHMQDHGTLKDTQGALRHASITTTGNIYVQVIEPNVMRAVNSHANATLDGWTPPIDCLGLKGRNIKRLPAEVQGL